MRLLSLPILSGRLAAIVLLSLCSAHGAMAADPEPAPATAPAAAPELDPAEVKFRSEMGLDKAHSVEYRDAKGVKISFAEYQKLRPDFPAATMHKTKSGDLTNAVVKLQTEVPKMLKPTYKVKLGTEFPDFKLPATDDGDVDNASLRGRYTLLSFYFAECAPCIKEVPMLNAFAESHKDITALAITFDSADDTKAFVKKTNFAWRTVANARSLINKVGVKVYPTLALLDPKGLLIAIGTQMDTGNKSDALEKWVEKSIAANKLAMQEADKN
jgi:peroxiredoxin